MDATKKHEVSLKKYITVCTIIALLAVAVGAFASQELLGRAIHNGKVLSKKQVASKQLDKNLEAAPSLIDSYEDLGANRPALEAALPNGADFSALAALVENTASEAGVSLQSVTPSIVAPDDEVEGEQKPQEIQFKIVGIGSYPALQSFLKNIERSARPIKVNTIQLTGTGSELNIAMDATSYYQPKASLKLKTEYVK